MAIGKVFTQVDEVIDVKTFSIASAVLLSGIVLTFIVSGLTGTAPVSGIEKTLIIPAHNTVAVDSGDLNQLDITSPPPKQIETKAKTIEIEDAIAGLHTETPYGLVPVIRKEDGLTPFKAYAPPFAANASAKALVSFVMTDFGLSEKTSESAIKNLPAGVTMVLDSYARGAQEWASKARTHGHEVWLSLPLQSIDYPAVDTGPKTVHSSLSDNEANIRMLQSLGIATGYSGVIVNNSLGFSQSQPLLQKILADIAGRGLGIVQSDKTDNNLSKMAAQTKAPYGVADVNIDLIDGEKSLSAKLIEIEAMAVDRKKLIVFFSPYPATVKALQDWSTKAAGRGIQFAPLSAIVSK
ncbi:MAG: hypothetical protein DI586_10370 [Micavibrio aeruginosavorus]|uniref:Divergent polysaccharide deacetylase family protein n=1 Tax=Micavibrio aeruginosavorus TaxID=349221 RepID=A0A2W5FGA9_9BACT|nr:MAG: hypothetical protein DI586_10370 [Micavibrio aeruginosavorus]